MRLTISKRESPIRSTGTIGRLMTVDPGLTGTGWATWNRIDAGRLTPPNASGAYSPTAAADTMTRMKEIAARLEIVIHEELVFEVVVECPQFMEGGRGIIAARDGDLVTLSILVGFLLASAMRVNRCVGHLVTVSAWKGNLSKEMTAERVRRLLPGLRTTTSTTHEMDAVGLGLYLKGAL